MKFRKFNLSLFIPIPLLLSLGLAVLYSVNPQAARQQLLYLILGFLIFFLLSFFDYRLLKKLWLPFYFLMVILLLGVILRGVEVRGAVRWLALGLFRIQPSEFSKFSLILTLAALFSPLKNTFLSLKKLLISLGLTLILAILVYFQPDLGTALSLLTIWGGMVLFAGIRPFYLFSLLAVGLILTFPAWFLLKEYQRQRILNFLNPKADPLGGGYHIIQAMIAVGSGQILGRGFGRGTQSHLQFLPDYYTDFIFASFAEEWGFLGVIVLLFLFGFLLWRILEVAKGSLDDFGALLSVGVWTLLTVQILINIGMNLGVMPITGIPLPLISYGGSSLLTTFALLGLVQSVAMRGKV